MECEERLDLADDFAARTVRFERLVEEAKEGAPHAVDTLATVGALISLCEQAWRQERSQDRFQVAEAVLTESLDAVAKGGQVRTKGRKVRCVHNKYVYLST